MRTGQLWTKREKQFLKNYYPKKGAKFVAEKLKRTIYAVRSQAVNISISGTGYLPYHAYSPSEIMMIKKYYPLYGSKYIAAKLGRSPYSIKDKARKLRVERRNLINWSPYEIEYLKKWYFKKRPSKIARHLERSTSAVVARARMLGLLKQVSRPWTPFEDNFLKSNCFKMTYKQLAKHLGRSPGSVGHRLVRALKVRKQISRKWTTREKRILGRLYGKISVAELAKKLNRTEDSVMHRAKAQKKAAKGNPVFSEEEKNFIHGNYLKMTNVQISEILKRPQTSVARAARKMGLAANPEKRKLWKRGYRKVNGLIFTDEEKDFIRKNYLTMTNFQIGKHLNRNAASITEIARKLGLQGNPAKKDLGHRNRQPSVFSYTEEDKNFIRDNYLKMSNIQIAKILNRHPASIQKILRDLKLSGNPEKLKIVNRLPYSEQEKQFIQENYFKMTNKEIGVALNRSPDSVGAIGKKLGLSGRGKKIDLWYNRNKIKE
jgi:DNA-binding CsgD family transcriptional regulator